jgi:hypothetical protein
LKICQNFTQQFLVPTGTKFESPGEEDSKKYIHNAGPRCIRSFVIFFGEVTPRRKNSGPRRCIRFTGEVSDQQEMENDITKI